MITGSIFQQLPDKLAGSQAAEKTIPKLGSIFSAVTSGQVGLKLEYACIAPLRREGHSKKNEMSGILRPACGLAFLLPLGKEQEDVSHRLRPGKELKNKIMIGG